MTDTCVLKRKFNTSFANNNDIKFSKMNHMKTKKAEIRLSQASD